MQLYVGGKLRVTKGGRAFVDLSRYMFLNDTKNTDGNVIVYPILRQDVRHKHSDHNTARAVTCLALSELE